MIEIKYDKNKFNMKTDATVSEFIACFVGILDSIEKDTVLKFAFEMAEDYRKDRDAKNNSDN